MLHESTWSDSAGHDCMDTPLKMKTQQKPGSKATRKDENDLKKYLKISKMTTTSIFGIWSLLSAFVSIPMKSLRDCIRDLSFSMKRFPCGSSCGGAVCSPKTPLLLQIFHESVGHAGATEFRSYRDGGDVSMPTRMGHVLPRNESRGRK